MTRLPNTFSTQFELYDQNFQKTSDDKKAVAKYWKYGSINKYYIRFDQNGLPMNPFDKEEIEESARRANLTKTEPFRWREVTKVSFNDYIDFLHSKNRNYLRKIERTLC